EGAARCFHIRRIAATTEAKRKELAGLEIEMHENNFHRTIRTIPLKRNQRRKTTLLFCTYMKIMV
ncbi:MAG: hypothetical protein JW708_08470, partial [Vallitaleaceae bacterium]|nr:hypothetical protein [Vallitaleaceae bacterium]